jgi:hypothetical protein
MITDGYRSVNLRDRVHTARRADDMDEVVAHKPGALRRAVSEIDPSRVVITYDRDADTLMLHLEGLYQPGVSVPLTDDVMVRMDRSRRRAIGLQIEHFLARVVHEHPNVLVALDAAELDGITREEVEEIKRRFGPADRKRAAIDALLAEALALDASRAAD